MPPRRSRSSSGRTSTSGDCSAVRPSTRSARRGHPCGRGRGQFPGDPGVATATYRKRVADAPPRRSSIATDVTFRIPAIRLAEAQTGPAGRPGCTSSSGRHPRSAASLGRCHGLELPFVFNTVDTAAGRCSSGTPPIGARARRQATWARRRRSRDPGAVPSGAAPLRPGAPRDDAPRRRVPPRGRPARRGARPLRRSTSETFAPFGAKCSALVNGSGRSRYSTLATTPGPVRARHEEQATPVRTCRNLRPTRASRGGLPRHGRARGDARRAPLGWARHWRSAVLKSANIPNYNGVLETGASHSLYPLSTEKGAELNCKTRACRPGGHCSSSPR